MAKARIWVWRVAALALVLSSSAIVRAQDTGAASTTSGPPVRLGAPFRQGATPAERKGLLEAWKEKRAQERRGVTPLQTLAVSNAVGRPSMVINSAGSVVYTRELAGDACDADMGLDAHWRPSTAYAQNDEVRPVTGGGGFIFRATNSGTTSGTEPVWPTIFGNTVVDGGVTWQATDLTWVADRTYPAGTTVRAIFPHFGFNFQTTSGGTTGGSEPHWVVNSNLNVSDGTVTWTPIGFFPGELKGCTPMQLVIQPPGLGAPTVIAQEGDVLDIGSTVQLSGWAEFMAMNSGGNVAFRGVLVAFPTDEDEAGSAILTAGPGAGALNNVAVSGDVVSGGGFQMCGFGPVVSINDAGQILFDAYSYFEPVWQPLHVYAAGNQVVPTPASGVQALQFTATAGTSGSTEPVWPTHVNDTVVDGTITWTASHIAECDEGRHNLVRNSGGSGNEFLFGIGTDVGSGVLVNGFGSDFVGAPGTTCACFYQDIDPYLNSSGHTSVAVSLSSPPACTSSTPCDTAAYLVTGPGTFQQVARTGGAGPGGTFGQIYSRTELNDSDQVLFKAQVGGVDKLIRWTAPSTYVVIASVGDSIGGETIQNIGFFGDINASGQVVFEADLVPSGNFPQGYYFWDGTTVTPIIVDLTAGDPSKENFFAQEMIMLNDAGTVAYTLGAFRQEGFEEGSELDETGLFVWTKAGGSQKMIADGDVIGGVGTVSSVNAQHPSFRKRQMNQSSCVATQYYVGGITDHTGGTGSTEDEAEGNGPRPYDSGIPPAGQLFRNCAAVCPTITVNPATLPGGTTGVPYSQTITQSGGAPPATFTITSGTQPTGLSLASGTGKLTGTPTATGTFNFDVTATDKNGCQGVRSYSIMIVCPTITLLPSSLPSGTIGVFYSQTITQSGGSAPATFAITSGAQPTGTSLSSSGTLSGTPTATGPFTFDVTATDKFGCMGVHTYTVTINPCIAPAAPVLSISPSSAHVGDPVKLTWTSTMTAGQGNYLVQRSVGGGSFSTIGTIAASSATTMTFTFSASNPTGTQTFQVVAVPICNPTLAATSNTVTLDVSPAVAPPTCNAPPAPAGLTVSPNPVIPGQGYTLSWQAASGADHYNVSISTDGGATTTSLGFVYTTSFSGTAPTTATGTIIFYVNSVANCGTAGSNTSITVPVGQACIAPEPVTNITVQANGVTPARPPSPTEYIQVSWTPSATGTKPTRYSVRINGDPEIFVIGTMVVLPPRGNSDPITAFVTPYGCAALVSAETFDESTSSWSTTGNLGLPRQEHTATLLSTGKVLVTGGVPNLFSPPTPTSELFDPNLNLWTPTGTLGTPRAEQSASALGSSSAGTATGTRSVTQVGSQVLVEGGSGATSPLASSELYDATAGTWSGVGNLTDARDLHTATVLQDGRVLVAGGLAAGPLASAEIYDPTTKVWTSTGSLATARYRHTATLLSNGKVLVAGGFGDAGALASAELFDPAAGTWTATGSLATAREGHSAALLSSGKVLVEGGDDGTNPIASAELYDPAAGTWSATGSLIAARRNHTSTTLADGRVLVAGGFAADLANALKSSELYDPTAGTFSVAGSLKGAHGLHTATLLGNGKVLVAGAADKLGVEQVGTTADSGPIALFLSPPVASFTISANPTVGTPVTFTDTSTPQATSWLWIFDEGTANDPDPTKRLTSTLQSPTHVYSNAGTHQVTLVASNGAGSSNATQSFNVAAASSVTRIVVSHTVQFDMTDPTRRRVAIQLTGPNNTLLTLNTSEKSETIVFLRFLDPGGKLIAERRLSVQPGSPGIYDLGAYGYTGRFSIELVSAKQFTSSLTVRGRNVREVNR